MMQHHAKGIKHGPSTVLVRCCHAVRSSSYRHPWLAPPCPQVAQLHNDLAQLCFDHFVVLSRSERDCQDTRRSSPQPINCVWDSTPQPQHAFSDVVRWWQGWVHMCTHDGTGRASVPLAQGHSVLVCMRGRAQGMQCAEFSWPPALLHSARTLRVTTNNLRAQDWQWQLKHRFMLRVLRLGYNLLYLDNDIMLLQDPYVWVWPVLPS
jgi:hypothetical protein